MKRKPAKISSKAKAAPPARPGAPAENADYKQLDDATDPDYQLLWNEVLATVPALKEQDVRVAFALFKDRRDRSTVVNAAERLVEAGSQDLLLRVLRDKLAILSDLKPSSVVRQAVIERATKVATWLLGVHVPAYDALTLDPRALTSAINGLHGPASDSSRQAVFSACTRINIALNNDEPLISPASEEYFVDLSGRLHPEQKDILKFLFKTKGNIGRKEIAMALDKNGNGVEETHSSRLLNDYAGRKGLIPLGLVVHEGKDIGYRLNKNGRAMAKWLLAHGSAT